MSRVSNTTGGEELAPEFKTLIEGEAVFQATLASMRPAVRADINDVTSRIPFDKLDALIKPWWDQATSTFNETGPPPPTLMATEVSRQLVVRQVRLRYAMGFGDAESYAAERFRTYFGSCTDYLGCSQMVATLGDIVQILPTTVLSHLTGLDLPLRSNAEGWTPDLFAKYFDAPQILKDFAYPPEDEELAKIVRFSVKALALTALFYHATKIDATQTRGNPIHLSDDHLAILGMIIDRVLEEARRTWLVPNEPLRRSQSLQTALQKIFSRYFDEEKRAGDDSLKSLKPELKEAFQLRATHVVNAVVRTVQGVASMHLYLQRLMAPSTRDWVRLMTAQDADTALFTYARFLRHESMLPGRAIYLEGMLRRMQANDVQRANAVDDSGNVHFVPQPLHKSWAAQGDVFVATTDMHVDVMLRDNFGIPDIGDIDMNFPGCSRRQPAPEYAVDGRSLHALTRCEEYLGARDPNFGSLLYRIERLEGALDLFTRKQNIVVEEQEKIKAQPALSRWSKSILDEFNYEEDASEVRLQGAMSEFFNQLVALHCYRLPLLKTLPEKLEIKLVADPNPEPIDVMQACAPTDADKGQLRDPSGALPRFAGNVSNYLETREVSKLWKEFRIQASLLVANAIVVAPLGPLAGAVTKAAAWGMRAIKATQLATRLGMPRFAFSLVRMVFEMTAFSVMHKASTIMVLLANGADQERVLAQAWDSQRSWWDNLGESVTLGVATVFLLPVAGNFANKAAGRLTGLRNSVHFKKVSVTRRIGFATIAIPIENAAFPLPSMALKFAEDAYNGRLAELDPKGIAMGAGADYLHSIPVSMVFRVWHGVGGTWMRAPFKSDIRAKLSKILDDAQLFRFASEGFELQLKGGMSAAYVKELRDRVAQTRERAKALDELLHEYYMLQPEVQELYPDESARETAVRKHIEVFRTERSPLTWLDEFSNEPIKSLGSISEDNQTGFEGL